MRANTFHYSMVAFSVVVLLIGSLVFYSELVPSGQVPLSVYTLCLLASVSIQIVERFFTTPRDVLVNCSGLLLVLLPLKNFEIGSSLLFSTLVIWATVALVLALLASILFQPEKPDSLAQRCSLVAGDIATKIGRGRLIFAFAIFLLIIQHNTSISKFYVLAIVVLLTNILLDRPPLPNVMRWFRKNSRQTGTIVSTIGKEGFRGVLSANSAVPARVLINYNDEVFTGAVINSHRTTNRLQLDFVRTYDTVEGPQERPPRNEFSIIPSSSDDTAVGYVTAGTTVSELVFNPREGSGLEVGNILQVQANSSTIYYQIQDAEIRFDTNNISDGKADITVGRAAQLGTYNFEKQLFQRFDWVPDATTVVSRAKDFPDIEPQPGEFLAGNFPGTAFPVYLNVDETITHHCAILGVTGTGKSIFAREFIRQTMSPKTKFVCVDITNEYNKLFGEDACQLVPSEILGKIAKSVQYLYTQRQEFANKRDNSKIQEHAKIVTDEFAKCIQDFMDGDKHIAVVEFADLSGTIQNFEFLKWLFQALFDLAKQKTFGGTNVCIVLEEAHTIVPEWNFVADNDKAISSLLNSISQIALQGRKYGVGLLVIAQRTANVSKTILTQCNTVIAFQQFDKTSSDFLESFVGGDAGRILPNLRPRTAIATGKGLRSSTPVIFEVPHIDEGSTRSVEILAEAASDEMLG